MNPCIHLTPKGVACEAVLMSKETAYASSLFIGQWHDTCTLFGYIAFRIAGDSYFALHYLTLSSCSYYKCHNIIEGNMLSITDIL